MQASMNNDASPSLTLGTSAIQYKTRDVLGFVFTLQMINGEWTLKLTDFVQFITRNKSITNQLLKKLQSGHLAHQFTGCVQTGSITCQTNELGHKSYWLNSEQFDQMFSHIVALCTRVRQDKHLVREKDVKGWLDFVTCLISADEKEIGVNEFVDFFQKQSTQHSVTENESLGPAGKSKQVTCSLNSRDIVQEKAEAFTNQIHESMEKTKDFDIYESSVKHMDKSGIHSTLLTTFQRYKMNAFDETKRMERASKIARLQASSEFLSLKRQWVYSKNRSELDFTPVQKEALLTVADRKVAITKEEKEWVYQSIKDVIIGLDLQKTLYELLDCDQDGTFVLFQLSNLRTREEKFWNQLPIVQTLDKGCVQFAKYVQACQNRYDTEHHMSTGMGIWYKDCLVDIEQRKLFGTLWYEFAQKYARNDMEQIQKERQLSKYKRLRLV